MSVNVQFDVTNVNVEEKTTESTFTVNGSLTTFQGVDIAPATDDKATGGSPYQVGYDFSVGSSGAAGPVVVNVNARGVVLGPNLTTPQLITDFFTNIANTGELHVVQRLNRHGQIHYDLFFTNAGTGAIDPELRYQQLIVPPGTLPAPIATGAAVIDTVTVFREWRGENKVYDVFVLEGV